MSEITTFVAMVTCFDRDERINEEAVRVQVRRQALAGNSLLCCGTNGDFTSLTFEEKLRLCEVVCDEVKRVGASIRIFANAGCPSTHETILLGRELCRLGVDALAVITPYFIACTQEGLFRHFSRVADAMERPVYLYDIPARTQNHIEPATAARLASHPNILGIKDSGGSRESLDAYLDVARAHNDFAVFAGPDSLIHYALERGAAGCVSGLGNVAPDMVNAICARFAAGDATGSAAMQERFTALRTDLYAHGYPPAMVKRALYLMDPSVGASREPALIPTPELDATLRAVLVKHQLLA